MNATAAWPVPPRSPDRAPGAEPTQEERAAAAAVLRMIQGLHVSRAVYLAAELGIADRLADGPVSAADLARATQAHEPSLHRVLRLLASLGVLTEDEPGRFGLTLLGERLRTGVPASVRSWALLTDAVGGIPAFGRILDTVRTGTDGVRLAHGTDLFEFLARHPENSARFDAAMSERTAAYAPGVAACGGFARMRTVVDVGGGRGTLLAAVLRRHERLRGILVETPAVVAGAAAALRAAGLADRCAVVAGDFFAGVPAGADGYLLANVLHDWDDDRSVRILAQCRRAMAPGGRVLIVERLIPDDPAQAAPTLLSDLNMLVITGGRERTNAEYGGLLAAAGLRLGAVRPVAFPYGVIEGLAV
jgi:SAM-dependent methyltransferase